MTIAVEKKIDLSTSVALRRIRSSLDSRGLCVRTIDPPPLSRRWRKMFSTIITVASTMIPKSIAPTDRRFAESPRKYITATAKNNAKGIDAETMIALRRLRRTILNDEQQHD